MTEVGVMDVMDRVANVLLGSRGNTYCSGCLAASLEPCGCQRARGSAGRNCAFGLCLLSAERPIDALVRPRQDRDLLK